MICLFCLALGPYRNDHCNERLTLFKFHVRKYTVKATAARIGYWKIIIIKPFLLAFFWLPSNRLAVAAGAFKQYSEQ